MPTTTFGRAEAGLFGDIWGITSTPGGGLLVFDAGNTRVLGFTDQLTLSFESGSAGSGPGEFTYQRIVPGDWIAAGDSSYVVLDLRSLSEFTMSGSFLRYATGRPPFQPSVMAISFWDEIILFSTDEIDLETGNREVRTWRLEESGEHALLRVDPMPTLPRSGGRLIRGIFIDQAEPLWASHAGCVYISDGAGDWIGRIHLPDMQMDTIRLPPREIPSRTEEDEAHIAELRASAAQVGISAGAEGVEPTARLKWKNLIIDPDGYVWLEPWRPRSREGETFSAWIINPMTGAVDSVALEAFPRAFVAHGAFVATAYDSTRGITYLRRYGRSSGKMED